MNGKALMLPEIELFLERQKLKGIVRYELLNIKRWTHDRKRPGIYT